MIKRIISSIITLLMMSGCFFVIMQIASYEAHAESWHIEIVDGTGDVGSFTSMALDEDGNAHISYYDEGNGWLKYAKWTGNEWSVEVIDTDCGGFYPGTSIALDGDNRAHIAYESNSDYCLKYAKWTGSSWNIQTVDPTYATGDYASLALDSNDDPHISYFYRDNGDLRYARWTGSDWDISIVSSGTWVGEDSSLALDSNDDAHISYRDSDDDKLKVARWLGGVWFIETVYDDAGLETSIAIDSEDNRHISFYESNTDDLYYARWTGSSWAVQAVDSSGDVGRWSSLVLDGSDHPHISYYDWDNEDLKYAEWTGNEWNIMTIDSQYSPGWFSSIELDSSENVHISYFEDSRNDLKYAKTNHAPGIPLLPSGPDSGLPNISYEYSTSATDPDDDQIYFSFDWGDGTISETDFVNSESQVLKSHSWQSSGYYFVKVNATDVHGAISQWSSSIIVKINTPPETPSRPSGPMDGETGITYYFTSKSTDLDGDDIKYTFDWGDGTNSVTDFVNSGITANRSHIWNDPRDYQIKVRATDTYGSNSEWTKILTIDILENFPPSIVLNSPRNNSVIFEPTTIEFEITDNDLYSIEYSRNGMDFTELSHPYSLDTTLWEDGKTELRIRATDSAGNMQERWYEFYIDYTSPEIISITPYNDEMKIDVEAAVVIEFSEQMNCDSVESAFSISPYEELTFSWNEDNQTVTVKSLDPFEYGTYYTIAIGTTASDQNGHRLESKYELGFTTMDEPENNSQRLTQIIIIICLIALAVVILAILLRVRTREQTSDTTISNTKDIRCARCQRIFRVKDSMGSMNIKCPFCSTLLALGPLNEQSSQGPHSQPILSISCPHCNNKFSVYKSNSSNYVQCPKCGTSGMIG